MERLKASEISSRKESSKQWSMPSGKGEQGKLGSHASRIPVSGFNQADIGLMNIFHYQLLVPPRGHFENHTLPLPCPAQGQAPWQSCLFQMYHLNIPVIPADPICFPLVKKRS